MLNGDKPLPSAYWLFWMIAWYASAWDIAVMLRCAQVWLIHANAGASSRALSVSGSWPGAFAPLPLNANAERNCALNGSARRAFCQLVNACRSAAVQRYVPVG